MEFPSDIWREIMSYFHSSYKKPLHYDAYTNMDLYKEYSKYDKSNMNSSLYRYILDDYSFCYKASLIDSGKWNPFMTRYCWLAATLHLNENKLRKLWNENYNYKKNIIDDFKIIIRILDIPSMIFD